MDTIKKNFRATYGLDAAGEKLINVAKADRTVMSDGVNVEYFYQENTIQVYDPNRGYLKNFAVTYNDKIWISQSDVPAPAGAFQEGLWKPTRVDPKWVLVQSGNRILQAGDYLSVDSALNNPIEFTLPTNVIDGDTIVIRDIGGRVGYTNVVVKAAVQSIRINGISLREYQLTIPYAELVFVYNNRLWNLFVQAPKTTISVADPATVFEAQVGNSIIRRYSNLSPITIKLPKYANNGDMIQMVGMDHPSTPYYHCIFNTFDDNTSVMTPGQKQLVIKYPLSGYLIFNGLNNTWGLYDNNTQDRLRTVDADTLLRPSETVSVVGQNNTTIKTITLTLPVNVQSGDQITVALNYMRKGQTVIIKAGDNDKILSDQNLLQFPKRSSYPPEGNWVNTPSLTFNGASSYLPILTFAYIPMGDIGQWMVVENNAQIERVDPTDSSTRGRLGVIALATQTQANLDKSAIDAASKEVAITPETLANRTALENRQGIARIATQAENAYTTGSASYSDETIVTPKKLDAKQSTESMRGLAEIATQTETNAGTDDSRIITPKKLAARYASETLSGIVFLTQFGATEATSRTGAGTGVYNFNDHTRVVTPKIINEWKSSELSLGGGFLATESEVIAGIANPANQPLIVTPFQLHKKTATESRIGFTQTATQAETNAGTDDFKYITPKKFAGRVALENQTGVAKIATQSEFDDGILDNVISTPLKIKNRFNNTNRTSVSAESGLVEAGTLWDHYTLDILEAKEAQRGTLKLSTQAQTNAGTDDTTAITPKKLQAKKSTVSAYGINRVATTAETVSGALSVETVAPAQLKFAIQESSEYRSTTTIRGTVKMTENALTFVGDNVSGNTQDLNLYQKEGYAISPYELNKTLANYMPLRAKAVDSDLLDGIDSTQFIRRDIDQTVNGNLNLVSKSLTADNVYSRGIVNANSGLFQSDSNHYIDLGKSGVNRIILGSYAGGVQIYDTNSKAVNVEFTQGGSLRLDGNLNSSVVNSSGTISVGTIFYVGGQESARIAGGTLIHGNMSIKANIRTNDVVNGVVTQDSTGTYRLLNEKNYVSIGEQTFIKRAGDSVSGRINFTSPITSTIPQSSAKPNAIPDSGNFGTWTIDITDSAIYNTMKGYLVAVPDINAETGQPTGYIKEYQEFKGPGTLSQFGSSDSNGSGTYRIWAPRPPASNANTAGHIAGTFYINHWNPITNKWDGWGRMYTSNNPPTANEIGAMSNNGSVFDSLRIRDWIQVGNLRISADPTTKSAKFEWIE